MKTPPPASDDPSEIRDFQRTEYLKHMHDDLHWIRLIVSIGFWMQLISFLSCGVLSIFSFVQIGGFPGIIHVIRTWLAIPPYP